MLSRNPVRYGLPTIREKLNLLFLERSIEPALSTHGWSMSSMTVPHRDSEQRAVVARLTLTPEAPYNYSSGARMSAP
jgi:hypothetical protein